MKRTSCALLLAVSLRAQSVSFSGHRIHIGEAVYVRLGNGDGTFRNAGSATLSSISSALRSFQSRLAIGDFNGDGKPDLAVAGGPGTGLSMLLGQGDGTFQPAQVTTLADAGLSSSPATSTETGNWTWWSPARRDSSACCRGKATVPSRRR